MIAMDSFKGCLTSQEANKAAAEGIRKKQPEAECICLPMSDGGEGMLEAFTQALGGVFTETTVHDPLMRPIRAQWGYCKKTAIIEMAQASGLTRLSDNERDPLRSTSFGVGELIAEAVHQGCESCIIGLGGSATCDGGVGMLQALGFDFMDSRGQFIEAGAGGGCLKDIQRICSHRVLPELKEMHFTIASDVNNPLYGPKGAAEVFAPQKGADAQTVAILDQGLENLAQITSKQHVANTPGAGAAGGVGFAIHALLGGEIRSGAELLLNLYHFDELLHNTTAVITGEGCSDRQTLMGKLPFVVLKHAQSQSVPTQLLAGRIDDYELLLKAGFDKAECINPKNCNLCEAMQKDIATKHITATVSALISRY